MSEISNKNMLNPTGFTFNISRIPSIEFFVQSISLPGITLGSVDQPTAFKQSPIPGDSISYSELEVTFKISENLDNYIAIFSWITGLGFPDNFDQYRELALKDRDGRFGKGIRSDCTLTVNTSSRNPAFRVEIKDAFPTALTPLDMSTSDASIEYPDATVSFRFENYTFVAL